jgi:DNA repair protein RecN (Recombination protein N)
VRSWCHASENRSPPSEQRAYHWSIHKHKEGKRTVTQIALLTDTERLEELASMLRGEARGETTRQEAAAMLEAARQRW